MKDEKRTLAENIRDGNFACHEVSLLLLGGWPHLNEMAGKVKVSFGGDGR